MSTPRRDRDELDGLGDDLAGLEERPVAEHPDVLEAVHAALTGELDRLVIPKPGEPRRP